MPESFPRSAYSNCQHAGVSFTTRLNVLNVPTPLSHTAKKDVFNEQSATPISPSSTSCNLYLGDTDGMFRTAGTFLFYASATVEQGIAPRVVRTQKSYGLP